MGERGGSTMRRTLLLVLAFLAVAAAAAKAAHSHEGTLRSEKGTAPVARAFSLPRGGTLKEGLKARRDDLLRERSPEAFGELAGHHTEGLDVAQRRSMFLEVRRLILLAVAAELLGKGSFLVHKRTEAGMLTLELGVLVAIMVFFGCDRVVLAAVRAVGLQHFVCLVWTLYNGIPSPSAHLAVSIWGAAVAAVCAYFGRQL